MTKNQILASRREEKEILADIVLRLVGGHAHTSACDVVISAKRNSQQSYKLWFDLEAGLLTIDVLLFDEHTPHRRFGPYEIFPLRDALAGLVLQLLRDAKS